jgi:hypothetical protein
VLDISSGAAQKITGTEPLWPKSQPPVASQLSATLAHAVANSGLFYESHLAQLTAGTRTLAQLMQEPQARLEASAKLAPVAQAGQVAQAASGAQSSKLSPLSALTPLSPLPQVGPSAQATPAAQVLPAEDAAMGGDRLVQVPGAGAAAADSARPMPSPGVSVAANVADGVIPVSVEVPGENGAPLANGRMPQAPGLPGAAPAPPAQGDAALADGGGQDAPAPLPNSVPRALAAGPESAYLQQSSDLAKHTYESIQQAEGVELAVKMQGASVADGIRGSAQAPAAVHPDAVALVRQQLELLAVPVFRWGGEAWPGVPMAWEIQEEAPQERQSTDDGEAVERTWSTRLALTLPTLKDVEVRISLAGTALQVRLAASEGATRELLGDAQAELPERLRQLGLQLAGLHIGLPQASSTSHEVAKDDDGRSR